ncbi:MAG TPA: GNAT family N-acetyltransferase [Ignavibacteriaceae bacterium]|nr:GNAT family N-acetyltransferase [Ignavibacteriaceae bacterium]
MKNNSASSFLVSTDKNLLDRETIFSFLASSYWAKDRSKATIVKTLDNSLCFGLYNNGRQIGFARVITDYSVFAYLLDVFISKEFRGKGGGKKLIKEILNYPDLKEVKKWMLATKDAHVFYEKFGFVQLKNHKKYMEYSPSPQN